MAASAVEAAPVLECTRDHFGGATIDAAQCDLAMSPTEFKRRLEHTLQSFEAGGTRGVWLKIPLHFAAFVPVAAELRFEFHHAEPSAPSESSHVMMTRWLPSTPCTLPKNASHFVGVGGFVVNDRRELLVIKEGNGPKFLRDVWKLPGGAVDVGEQLPDAAVREVFEETGVRCEFVAIACFRHQHAHSFGKSDLYFVCMLRPLSSDLVPQESEIAEARWMPLDEFLTLPVYSNEGLWGSMMRHAAAVFDGSAPAVDVESLPHFYRPGTNYMYSAHSRL